MQTENSRLTNQIFCKGFGESPEKRDRPNGHYFDVTFTTASNELGVCAFFNYLLDRMFNTVL